MESERLPFQRLASRRRGGDLLKIAIFALILAAVLPQPGTQFHELPKGAGRAEVEAACYACHSADLLVQQRLTEKQWTAAVEKMMRWGAPLEESKKSVVIAYLAKNFGPNNKFRPIAVSPVHPVKP